MKWLLVLIFVINPIPTIAKIYQIEMIVFSQPTFQTKERTVFYIPPDINSFRAKAVSLLPTSEFLLNNEQDKLNRNSEFHILLHVAWKQSITHLHTPPVRIEDNGVQVLFRANVQHYFNVSLWLFFNQAPDWYFHYKRRMRSNQLNYIDCLYYGILLKIVPI